MDTAKLFWTGRSQAVRLPKSFRIDADEVRIRRHGSSIVLEPVADDWSWLDDVTGLMSNDFMAEGREQPADQDREALDRVFE